MDDFTIDPSVLQESFLGFQPYELSKENSFFQEPDGSSFQAPDDSSFQCVTRDSAVDLSTAWSQEISASTYVKQEFSDDSKQFFDLQSPVHSSRSPSADQLIFSGANSPGAFFMDPPPISSPTTPDDCLASHAKSSSSSPPPNGIWGSVLSAPDAIVMPQSMPQPVNAPKVVIVPDKTKTRAETQIKVHLVVDPLDNVELIRFPRKTLSKPKQFVSDEEKRETESKGKFLAMDCMLVCATAIKTPEQKNMAFLRAAGREKLPRRDYRTALSELDKGHPAHPQNGGEVLICDGCRERERKRYDRKKKRAEDETEYIKYDRERVILINEREYMAFKAADLVDPRHHFSNRAKQVSFNMRITCYCRHQEEKSPMGYRIIFTFTNANGEFVAQHLSDVFHITDDHKNKDPPEPVQRSLTRPTFDSHQQPSSIVVPMYSYQVDNPYTLGGYSQPQTPVSANFQTSLTPTESTFPQATISLMSQPLRQSASAYPLVPGCNPTTTAAQYTRHQRGQSYFEPPMPNLTGLPMVPQIPRPQSFDNFNFGYAAETSLQQSYNYYASAPQSTVTTPINLSRPASPTWEQGPPQKKKQQPTRCVYFRIGDQY
jgi:hypothetical protein